MEVLEGLCKECKDKKWGKWSPDEALLACVNMLHRWAPSLHSCAAFPSLPWCSLKRHSSCFIRHVEACTAHCPMPCRP